MNPRDASDRRLREGDEVIVANDTGQLAMHVTLTESLPRGVVLSNKGRWPKLESGQRNVNFLNPGRKADMGGEHECPTVRKLRSGVRIWA